MLLNSIGGSRESAATHDRSTEHAVQGVFSEVLATVGREGYVSAAAVPTERPLNEEITASWSDWFDGECRSGRYQGQADAERLKQDYGQILVRALEDGGYADPKAFLRSLSTEDLAVAQEVHRLADRVAVDELSEEGALNLLIPPPAQVDLDRDGLTRSGAAWGLRFPDSNTPLAVAQAWEEATAGMSMKDRMLYEFQMKLPLLTANIACDEEGRFLHCYGPGDPGFTNPMASDDYSYVEAAQERLDYLERFRKQMPAGRYEEDTSFWTKLRGLLIEFGAK